MQLQLDRMFSVGDAVGMAVRRCRRDFPFLFRKLLAPSVVELIGKFMFLFASRAFLEANRVGGMPHYTTLLLMFAAMIFMVPGELWLTVRQLGYVRMIVLGMDSYDETYKIVRGRFWHIILYAILFYIAIVLWLFACILAFTIGSFIAKAISAPIAIIVLCILVMIVVGAAGLIALMLPLSILFAVLACEDVGVFQTLGRAFAMTYKRFSATAGFANLSFFTNTLLYYALTSLLHIAYSFFYYGAFKSGGRMPSPEIIPVYLQIIGYVWISFVQMFLMPVALLSSGFYYYSLRMRKEGLDIINALARLKSVK